MSPRPRTRLTAAVLALLIAFAAPGAAAAQTALTRGLPDPYYPQRPQGELRLNYYYDRSGRWVKFSDWIPFRQRKYEPMHLEDFYELYGLPHHYNVSEIKESIYWLVQAMTHRFRHPRQALCQIETEEQYHKYRLLMFMQINMLVMRMYLRLGSMYDKRHLYFHDLDMADDLEVSFLAARTYYREAIPYWRLAKRYAQESEQYRFDSCMANLEDLRFQIGSGRLNFDRIIERHIYQVEAKLGIASEFLDIEGRPRPVRQQMQRDIEGMYDDRFRPAPLGPPQLEPLRNEQPLFAE
ncbi:MAG: hypothetical protein K1X75_09195 [Leptospirales bacterium]|nr:hypothetical protein [Leptospirales bacterium]